VGYIPLQPKVSVIELDKNDKPLATNISLILSMPAMLSRSPTGYLAVIHITIIRLWQQ
jgi:hypothetical protein